MITVPFLISGELCVLCACSEQFYLHFNAETADRLVGTCPNCGRQARASTSVFFQADDKYDDHGRKREVDFNPS